MTNASGRTLQDLIDSVPDLVDYFYNDTQSPHPIAKAAASPVPLEFSNWREEQRAWRESVLLLDQSHHMPESFIKGPDAIRLLSDLGINSFEKFEPLRGKQYIGCSSSGYVIGECVLQHLDDGTLELISGMYLQDWVQYNAEVGKYNVTIRRDNITAENPNRTNYRCQLEGPHAEALFNEVIGGPLPDIPFFRLARVEIAGVSTLALRHGVAGHKGVELSCAYKDGPKVRDAIVAAGKKYGLRLGGLKTYFSTLGEVGWIGYPTPAIFTDPEMVGFRKWLPADSWEARVQLAGSFKSRDIRDYYMTPWDLGLGKLIKFDHDFVGRKALEKMAAEGNHREKVTLVWNDEDVIKIFASLFGPDEPYKFLEMPRASYGFAGQQTDEVRTMDGKLVGLSNFVGYTVNERKFLSVAIIDQAHAVPGTQVTVTWGEPDGGSRKPSVERHRQLKVRATVAPAPYAKTAQLLKNAGMTKASAKTGT